MEKLSWTALGHLLRHCFVLIQVSKIAPRIANGCSHEMLVTGKFTVFDVRIKFR